MSNDRRQLREEKEEESFTLVTSRRKPKLNRKPTVAAHSVVGCEDEAVIDKDSVLK